jgi:hypothetical protein
VVLAAVALLLALALIFIAAELYGYTHTAP